MKLFTKYNRINLGITIGIFMLSSFAFSVLLYYVLLNEVDNSLKIEQREIEAYIAEHGKLPEPMQLTNQKSSFTPIDRPLSKRKFIDVRMDSNGDHGSKNGRQLIFSTRVSNRLYRVEVVKSLEETEDLVRSIIIITLSTILLILVATLLINRIVLKRLWLPFYNTLSVMKKFKLGQHNSLQFEPSNLDEFAFMNKTLKEVTDNADKEYTLLKEFTENASHELQTPLAIIRTKLDLLIQDESLTEHHLRHLQGAYDAVQKMSRLNQSLLLLAKIENNQFHSTEYINLRDFLHDKIDELDELFADKHLKVAQKLAEAHITINPILCEILFNNLLANGIRHNHENGCISLDLSAGKCIISNSGIPNPLDNSRIFNRFYTSQFNTDHHGLGLAIIKQICDVSNIAISYHYNNGIHSFELSW
ncbi:HAMP domain-containing sensor histidine kinase [Danxiaibacter flavus]|uniref:histidine kinase n=1 Tax=Danxiaibacter flavus TaxID=3049108 RepID=A0ABV3ZC36_9BACT|nr:HAMP domain-containing sensor histidine kinase [Chitinophagaceae bacterium DXS]